MKLNKLVLAVAVTSALTPNVAAKASVGFSNDSDAGIGFGF